jgi:hypothetical protein
LLISVIQKKTFIFLLVFITFMTFGLPVFSQSSQSSTFKDFFTNPDYSDPSIFLQSGTQTEITDSIENLAGNVNASNDLDILKQIYDAVCSVGTIDNAEEKFTRTVAEIVNEGLTGCTDYALVFASIARYKGIPSIVVDSGRMDWVSEYNTNTGNPRNIRGHAFVECYINNTWYLVDSTAGKVYKDYSKDNFCLPQGYYVHAKCTDLFETGVNNTDIQIDSMKYLYSGFDYTKYVEPNYNFYDLRDGMKLKMNSPFSYYYNYLVGGRAVVEAFRAKYPGIGNSSGISESVLFNQAEYMNNYPNANIVEFYQTNSSYYYSKLLPEFPELSTTQPGVIFKRIDSNSRLRILLVGKDVNQLLGMIRDNNFTSGNELNSNVKISTAPASRQVAVSGPDTAFIPRHGSLEAFYTAAVRDQFGVEMNNEILSWKLFDSNMNPTTGMTIGEDGILKIGPDVVAGTYTIKAIPRSTPSAPGYKTVLLTPESNEAPVFDSIDNKTVREGELLQFTVHAADKNNDVFTYTASNLPEGAIFNAATGEFNWTPGFDKAGVYESVKFLVSDGEMETSMEISITVKDKTTCSLIDENISCIKEMNLERGLIYTLTATLSNAKKQIEKKHYALGLIQLRVYAAKLDVLRKTKELSTKQYELLFDNLKVIKTVLNCEQK